MKNQRNKNLKLWRSLILFRLYIVQVSSFGVLIKFSVCGLPPEYCEFAGKGNDLEKCKLWLKNAHPELYEQIWTPAEGEEEKKEGEPGKGGKKKKGVKFTEATNKKIKVVK